MRYLVNGTEVDLDVPEGTSVEPCSDRLVVKGPSGTASALVVRDGDTVWVSVDGRTYEFERAARSAHRHKKHATGDSHAPMPGQVVDVFVEQGHQVQSGQKLLVLEAMKMQHVIVAPFQGTVSRLSVHKGDQVGEGQFLVHVEAADE